MSESEILKKISQLHTKRIAALERMVAPARAAANAMKDAGMRASADPLDQAIFEVDGVDAELKDLMLADTEAFLAAILGGLGRE